MRKFLIAVAMAMVTTSAWAQTVPVTGLVTKINAKESKITLKHEPIPNLEMDSMTMVFTVADAAMLKAVKVGDKVRFEADRVNGKITLVRLEKTK